MHVGLPLELELILWADLPSCLIAMMLPCELDSWLDLATLARVALRALLECCGMCPGWSSPCPAGHEIPSAPASPALREQPWPGCSQAP